MHTPFHKFESSDSIAFLDQRGGTGSSVSTSAKGKPLSYRYSQDDEDNEEEAPASALTVTVSLRRGRLLLLTVLVMSILVGVIVLLLNGVELTRFEASSKNNTVRDELLDDLNSYSGNVASAFGKPVELFVTILVQLILLTFMAHAYTQPTISSQQVVGRLVLSAGIGYLIGNGINAANVQLREMNVHAVILASDLAVASNISVSVASRMTSVTNTVPEMTSGNLVTNTVLRNAVMPRVMVQETICDWEHTRFENRDRGRTVPPTIDYGFTLRDWQSRLLQEALPTTSLKMVVNPTNKTANSAMKSGDLPMNASLAADLLLYSMYVGPHMFEWGTELNEAQLLPPSSSETETKQRDWFLPAAVALVAKGFNNASNTPRRDINVSFSHVEISPAIGFDAVTLEFEIDPELFKTARNRDNKTRYTQIAQANSPGVPSDCGPWPALCLVNNRLNVSFNSLRSDAPQLVHAISPCFSDNGNRLMAFGSGNPRLPCNESSAANSSFMVMTVGRRLVADSLEQGKGDNVTDSPGGEALYTNLRKIYTFTLGRLSWRLENLADAYGAECGSTTTSVACLGLQMPLEASPLSASGSVVNDSVKSDQRLVVSAAALPTDLILPSSLLAQYPPRSVPLVEVTEPPFDSAVKGDVVLPHNVGTVVWTNKTVEMECDSDIEGLVYAKVSNHMYIEHGFQTAYTAAMFFLFQNAVVKDTIEADAATKSKTLNFDGNTQSILAIVSTPMQNAWLTFAGCAILLVSVLVAVAKTSFVSSTKTDPVVRVTAPQAIARVMMDDEQFPALLLHRRVVDHHGEDVPVRTLDQFTITQVAVVHEDEDADDLAKHLKTK